MITTVINDFDDDSGDYGDDDDDDYHYRICRDNTLMILSSLP